nr:hypothetical protein [Tanacetum cinerariifolium]
RTSICLVRECWTGLHEMAMAAFESQYIDITLRIPNAMQNKLRLSKSEGGSTPAESKRMQNAPHASTGYVFILNGSVIDWKSSKQSIFATSSAEAEYIDAYNASKEAVCVRKFIFGLGVVPTIEEPISMYCDNTRSITIANESGITKGARHFHAKVHYLREVIEYGDVKLEKYIHMTT